MGRRSAPQVRIPTAPWKSGSCAWASQSFTADRVIRRPKAKDERFHRTLRLELLHDRKFRDLAEAQREFDGWREVYNFVRPHQALALEPPASRYRPSPRTFPEQLPPLEYASDLKVSKVQADAEIRFAGRQFKVGKAFIGLPVAIRPTLTDGVFHLLFAHSVIRTIDLRSPLHHV